MRKQKKDSIWHNAIQAKNIMQLYIFYHKKLSPLRPYSDFIILNCTIPGGSAHLIVDMNGTLIDV